MTETDIATDIALERDALFQLRGGSFTMMVLRLVDPGSEMFFARLNEKIRQAPNFFRNAPVVLDLDGLAGNDLLDFADFRTRLRECGLVPIAVQGGGFRHQEAALRVGLPLLPSGRPTRGETSTSPPVPTSSRSAAVATPSPPQPLARSTMIITEPVRSGRQIYAPGGDLVVTAMVSAGAEILADGSIHVYGALRGRALAGMSGNTSARIFCLGLEAEMVSIAGLYRIREDIPSTINRKAVQIYMKDGFLCLDPLPNPYSSGEISWAKSS